MSTTTRTKPSRAPMIAVLVIVVIIAALIGGEFYARNQIKSCLSDQLQSEIGTQVNVGFGLKPVLLSALDKKIPSVTIDSENAKFGPAQDMNVHAEIKDVNLQTTADSQGTIGSSSADVTWSTQGILATLQSQGVGSLVTGLTTDAAAGTIKFDVGPAGLAQLTVKPDVQGDKVQVQTVDASILGLGIPTGLVDSVVKVLSDSLQTYPLGMTPQSLTINDTGLQFELAGGQYTLPVPTAEQQQQAGAKPESCSVLG